MNQTTILTQKRHAHVARNNLHHSLRQSLLVLSKSLLSAPKHTYGSTRAKDYRPLGSATEEFPLPRLVKDTKFTDIKHKDELEPDLVLRVNVYPTISSFRSLEGVLIEIHGSSKLFCEQIIGAVDPKPEMEFPIHCRLRNSPLRTKHALLQQQKRSLDELKQGCFDSWSQGCTRRLEDNCDRLDKVMAERERRKQGEVEKEEEDELGETGGDEMEEDEEVLTKADNKKNRGKKSQRARLERKLRKAKEDKDDAKFEERNRRPLLPSPPQSDVTTLLQDMEFEDGEDWIVYSDKKKTPSKAPRVPVVGVESAIKEELDEVAQEPVIKQPPAISNTDEQALLSRDFNVQDSNALPDQGLEETLPSPAIRLPPCAANRENCCQETLSSPVKQSFSFAASKEIHLGGDKKFVVIRLPSYEALPPSAANREDDSQEALSSPVEKSFSFAASKETYLGADEEFVVVRLPSYEAPSTPKKEYVGEWDEGSSTQDKNQVKKARTPSPSPSETRDTQSQAPGPHLPGTPRSSPVQSSDAYFKADAASQIQEEEMSETLSAFSNDEQLEIQKQTSPSQSGTRRRPSVQTSEASSKTHVAAQIQEEAMSETLSAFRNDEHLEIQEWIRKQEEVLKGEIRQMEELFRAKSIYYDAAFHTHGNRRTSDPGPFSIAHLSRTTTSDHRPASLDLSRLDDKKTVKSIENESAKGKETSSSKRRKILFPPPGLGPATPYNKPLGFPPPKHRQKEIRSQSKPDHRNGPQNVYHEPYYQYPQPLQFDPVYGFQPAGYMGFYGQDPEQQMYETPLHLALDQQHLFDPNQSAMQWPNYYGTFPAQEYPAQENPSYPAQEYPAQDNPTQENPSYPDHWQ